MSCIKMSITTFYGIVGKINQSAFPSIHFVYLVAVSIQQSTLLPPPSSMQPEEKEKRI